MSQGEKLKLYNLLFGILARIQSSFRFWQIFSTHTPEQTHTPAWETRLSVGGLSCLCSTGVCGVCALSLSVLKLIIPQTDNRTSLSSAAQKHGNISSVTRSPEHFLSHHEPANLTTVNAAECSFHNAHQRSVGPPQTRKHPQSLSPLRASCSQTPREQSYFVLLWLTRTKTELGNLFVL